MFAKTARALQVRQDVAEHFYSLWASARVHRAKHPEAVEAYPGQVGAWMTETRQVLREKSPGPATPT